MRIPEIPAAGRPYADSPILFTLSEIRCARFTSPRAIGKAKFARSVVFQPQRRRAVRPRPERAAGERSRRRKPTLPYSVVGFSGASWETTAVPHAHIADIVYVNCTEPARGRLRRSR